jgi:endoglucanase
VNLNGAEFGVRDAFGRDATLPGSYGVDYIYPTLEEVEYFVSVGMNTFRLAFRWERLQPALCGRFQDEEWQRLHGFVRGAISCGATVILNPHNFARYHSDLIGSAAVPHAAFADFWRRLAERFAGEPQVIFGLVNEPHDMPTEQWIAAANEAIKAIRQTGSRHLILVPGNGYTGAHTWCGGFYGTPNARAFEQLTASAPPFAVEVHQYLDADGSGTSFQAISSRIGSTRLRNFTRWLRRHGLVGFLGEFASGTDERSLAALEDLLSYLRQNSDVWLGWTYWTAGPWWGDYPFSIEPSQQDGSQLCRPQMQVLERHLRVC